MIVSANNRILKEFFNGGWKKFNNFKEEHFPSEIGSVIVNGLASSVRQTSEKDENETEDN